MMYQIDQYTIAGVPARSVYDFGAVLLAAMSALGHNFENQTWGDALWGDERVHLQRATFH